jgi:Glycosyl hydrolases family 18
MACIPRNVVLPLALCAALCCACADSIGNPGGDGDNGALTGSSGSGSSGSSGGSSGGSSSGSTSGSGSGGQPSDAGPMVDATTGVDAGSTGDSGGDGAFDAPITTGAKESLVWIPTLLGDGGIFAANLQSVTSHPQSFTTVAPDFYDMNFPYTSGTPTLASDTFNGLSLTQVAQQVHAAGMKITPLMYAGAGNGGTDQGIWNVLNDSPAGTRNNLIAALVAEGQRWGWDGWNLDWEVSNTTADGGVGTTYALYGTKYVQFLSALKTALHAQNMTVSIVVGESYIRQCAVSEGDPSGYDVVDLTQIGPAVDRVIVMAYGDSYGQPATSCPSGTPPLDGTCDDSSFGAMMNIMCDVSPPSSVSIGLIQGSMAGNGGCARRACGTNPFLDQALNDVAAVGFTGVAVWPGDAPFLYATEIPDGGTWYSLLANYMSQ